MCVCVCVCPSPLLKINTCISENSGPIATKFYLKHNWGGVGEAALGIEQDLIGTLVSMATDSSHWVLIGKILLALYRFHF